MKWFPWLNPAYREIISSHQQGRAHHALLVHGLQGNGTRELIYGVSRYLMCQQPDGLKSCGHCHSCQLMMAETHPDYGILQPEKGKTTISIDGVRQVIAKLAQHAQQGGVKIIWLPDTETLTEAAANALLKTLEEPTEKTYFFLQCEQPDKLLATLRSRCRYFHLASPPLSVGIKWLQQQLPQVSDNVIQTALKLNQNAPATALSLLQPERWQERAHFCQQLCQAINENALISLLPVLNHDDIAIRLHWLMSVLLDSVKYQYGLQTYCINQDQFQLLHQIALTQSTERLLYAIDTWGKARHMLLSISGVNTELLLINQLLNWSNWSDSTTFGVNSSYKIE